MYDGVVLTDTQRPIPFSAADLIDTTPSLPEPNGLSVHFCVALPATHPVTWSFPPLTRVRHLPCARLMIVPLLVSIFHAIFAGHPVAAGLGRLLHP